MQQSDSGEDFLPAPTRKVLLALSTPQTASQVAGLVGKKRVKLQHYLKKHWIAPLTRSRSKGRLYVLTAIGRSLVGVPNWEPAKGVDWEVVSWLLGSPQQRLSVIFAVDKRQRTSEEIRLRTQRRNSHLTRISTKAILTELVEKGLVATAIVDRLRLYWITDEGQSLVAQALQISDVPLCR